MLSPVWSSVIICWVISTLSLSYSALCPAPPHSWVTHIGCMISSLRGTQHFGLMFRIVDLDWTVMIQTNVCPWTFSENSNFTCLVSEWRNLRPQMWEDDDIFFLDKRQENPWNFCQKAFISFSPFLLSMSWVSPFRVSHEVSLSCFAFLFQPSFFYPSICSFPSSFLYFPSPFIFILFLVFFLAFNLSQTFAWAAS